MKLVQRRESCIGYESSTRAKHLIYVTEINSSLTFGASVNRYVPINHKSRFTYVLIIKTHAIHMQIWDISFTPVDILPLQQKKKKEKNVR